MAMTRWFAATAIAITTVASAELPAGIPSAIENPAHAGQLAARFRTVLGLEVGKHKLGDVLQRFPGAEIFRLDDSDGSSKAICLRSTASNDDTQVVFEAGPLGGFEDLTGVTVAPRAAFPRTYKCVGSRLVTVASASAKSIKLGADLSELAKALNTRTAYAKSGLVEFPFERQSRFRDPKTGTSTESRILSGVVARVDSNRVRWFSIYFVEGS